MADSGIQGFVMRRRSLRDHYERIQRVDFEASCLVEELRRRRDGKQPREIVLSNLRDALDEVYPRV